VHTCQPGSGRSTLASRRTAHYLHSGLLLLQLLGPSWPGGRTLGCVRRWCCWWQGRSRCNSSGSSSNSRTEGMSSSIQCGQGQCGAQIGIVFKGNRQTHQDNRSPVQALFSTVVWASTAQLVTGIADSAAAASNTSLQWCHLLGAADAIGRHCLGAGEFLSRTNTSRPADTLARPSQHSTAQHSTVAAA